MEARFTFDLQFRSVHVLWAPGPQPACTCMILVTPTSIAELLHLAQLDLGISRFYFICKSKFVDLKISGELEYYRSRAF